MELPIGPVTTVINRDDVDANVQTVMDAFDFIFAPGATVGTLEAAVATLITSIPLSDVDLERMRDACVKQYDAKLAEHTAQGLPTIRESNSDPLPEVGTTKRFLIVMGAFMRGCNAEILKRQAAAQ